jgi:hypothetical protein
MELRELKALEIAARSRLTYVDGAWLVPSQTSGKSYRVTLGESPTCECDDWQLRQGKCKHILGAMLVAARDGAGEGPVIVTDAVPKKPTYKQNWPLYNEAQLTEKKRFQVLLYDLCRGLQEPPRDPKKTGRKPVPLSDIVFAVCFKVYSTFSSRRFNGDLEDAYEKGYLSRPLHPNKINTFLENPDLTPVLKALIVRSSLPLKAVETVFAPDSTGFHRPDLCGGWMRSTARSGAATIG